MADDNSKSACQRDNVTSSSDDRSPFTSARFIGPVAVLVAFNLVVVVGNSLVIAAVFTHRNLRTVTNTFIVSLAVSDLLLGAVVLPFSSVNQVLGWWPFGWIWCSAWLAIDVWVCTASILNLCAISLDRYLAISRPFRYPLLVSPTRAKVAVAVVWTLAMAICLPPLFGWRESDVANVAAATTKHPCDVVDVDYLDHTVKTISHATADGKTENRSLIQSSTMNDSHSAAHAHYCGTSVEINAINAAKHSTTNSILTQKRSYSTPLTSLISQSVMRAIYSKRVGEFFRYFATTSAVDVATNAAGRKLSRIRRGSGSGVDCEDVKNDKTADWNFVSGQSVDAPTTASYKACYATCSDAPRPVCMLTSEPGYIIYSACGSFWIPMFVMVFFYLKIYQTAVKTTTALSSGVLTKKMGRIAANSEVTTVNLRVHRGGGGARSPGRYWTTTPNREPPGRLQCGNDVDKNSDIDCSRELRTHGASTSGGNCFRLPASDRNISHDPVVIYGSDAVAADESCRHSATSGSTRCCTCGTTSSRVSSLSQRDDCGRSTGATDPAGLSHRRACSSTAANVGATPRPPSDDDDAAASPILDEGVERLVQSTLAPVFEKFSAQRPGGGCGNVELVDTSQAHARRRFVQIRTHLRRLNREKKAAKTVGVIIGCFVLCWAPFFTVYVLGVFCADCTPPIAFVVFFWLGYCNSAINPFVYALCSKDFRFAFRRLLRCSRGTGRHGNNATIAALVTRLRSPAHRMGR